MARYTGAVCRLCRREGMKLFLKGERCYMEKCAIEKRNVPPGQQGRGARQYQDISCEILMAEGWKPGVVEALLDGGIRP